MGDESHGSETFSWRNMISLEANRYSVLFDGFEEICGRLLQENKLDELLRMIARLAHNSFNTKNNVGKKLFYPELDKAIIGIANALKVKEQIGDKNKDLQVIIGTEFYRTGGHTRVAKAICGLSKYNLVVLTDLFGRHKGSVDPEIKEIFKPFPMIILNRDSMLEKAVFIVGLLKNLRPSKIVCLNHFQDPIPLVAMTAVPEGVKIYYHHCDYRPSLGASLRDFIHIDTTEVGRSICEIHSEANNPVFAPIPSETSYNFDVGFDNNTNLNTISMGHQHKYVISQCSSPFSYPHVIAEVLLQTKGKHFHIGNLTEGALAIIATVLKENDIEFERFSYLGEVPEGVRLVQNIPNPVYIPSFPIGGGLSITQMKACGVPILVKKIPLPVEEMTITDLAHLELLPPTCRYWSDKAELNESLEFIKKNYSEISDELKKHHLKYSSLDVFLNQIKLLISAADWTPSTASIEM
jgi:hypothetical protein